MNTLTFDEREELAALEAFESTVQMFCGQRAGRAAQIFAGFMTPRQHTRLASLRAKAAVTETDGTKQLETSAAA